MQYPQEERRRSSTDALQVLATTASAAHRSSQLDNGDQMSTTSSTNNQPNNISHDNKMSGGNNTANNSEDDESKTSRSSSSSSSREGAISKRTGLRKGKWSLEEEEYATRYIHYFSSGLLALPEGKTLRASLAEKLSCDPMRITKKYAGASCLGNKISKLCDRPKFSPYDVDMAKIEIARLERRFHLRLAQGVGVPLPKDTDQGGTSPTSTSPPMDSYGKQKSTADIQRQFNGQASVSSQVSLTAGAPVQGGFPQVASVVANNGTTVAAPPHSIPLVSQPIVQQQSAVNSGSNNSAQKAPPFLSAYLATLASNQQQAAAAANNNNVATAPSGMVVGGPPPVAQQPPVPPPVAVVQQQQPVSAPQPPSLAAPAPQAAPQQVAQLSALLQMMNQASMAANNNAVSAPSQQAAAPNQQFINTLILQISTHLQLLATLAPDKMKQIQLQILMSTLSPQANAPQQAPQGTNNPANLLANLQAALVNQQQLRNANGLPAASNPGLQNLLSVAAASQANGSKMSLVANGSLGGIGAPPGSTTNHAPPLNQGPGPQQANQQNVRRLSNASQASSVKSLKRKSPVATAQIEPQKFKAAPAAVVVPPPQKKQAAVTVPTASGHTMAEYLAKLRQGHAEALERARREQAESDGPASKKQKHDGSVNTVGNTSGGALLPFEHATTISSGSGCTTNGSSSSSIENLPSSDATRNDGSTSSTGNDGSTSSNTMSEEDETEQEQQASDEQELQDSESASARPISKSSVPRKRFLSRRNLADHNVRMAEEMKHLQDQATPPPNSNP